MNEIKEVFKHSKRIITFSYICMSHNKNVIGMYWSLSARLRSPCSFNNPVAPFPHQEMVKDYGLNKLKVLNF